MSHRCGRSTDPGVLRVGLSGGIGAGKTTVSRRLAGMGATVIDADVLARQVVAPRTPGLDQVVAAFGTGVLDGNGSLDRPALGRRVFGDDEARRTLEGIIHPAVAEAAARVFAAALPGSVVVHDVPLLVEKAMGDDYHLVVIVDVPSSIRGERLIRDRGMTVQDAQARIAAQADDAARHRAADVLVANTGTREQLESSTDRLWRTRLRPFADNLAAARPNDRASTTVTSLRDRAAAVQRLLGRLRRVLPLAVPGLCEAQLREPSINLELLVQQVIPRAGLAQVGFFLATQSDPTLFGSADPGQPATLRVRTAS